MSTFLSEKRELLNSLLKQREIEYNKLVQACQSGAYKAWKKRRKNLDKLNEQLRNLNCGYGDEKFYQNTNSKSQ